MSKDLEEFQKQMWSHEKPLLFAVAYVESLLEENKSLKLMIKSLATQVREEFNEDVRSKLDFTNFEK